MTPRSKAAAVLLAGLLALTACGVPAAGTTAAVTGPTGDPVPGGTATVLISADPRGLDPALISNDAAFTAVVGNALYSQLIIDDPQTGEITPVLAESLETADAGQTFTLVLRPGLVYSDGTPLTAEDVKFNWEHVADPATASSYAGNAREIAGLTVVDDRTLQITLQNPNAQFPVEVYETALNWIGKPETVQAGPDEVNNRPIGAGPFVLEEWRRQDTLVFARNDLYHDQPRPYLDRLGVRIVADEEQRLNTVISGGGEVAQEATFTGLARAEEQGRQVAQVPAGGGLVLALNQRRAPFDDVRARQALSLALDLEMINSAVSDGTGTVPATFFPPESPYHRDIPLHTHDPARAQALLDELAAEGKPLEFELTTYAAPSAMRIAQSVQTQVSTLDNITVTIAQTDGARQGALFASRDYDSIISTIADTGLFIRLRGGTGNNLSGVDDPQMNEALDASRRSLDPAEIAGHYEVVQQRMTELVPNVFLQGIAQGAYATTEVGGLTLYGSGSPLPERLWLSR